MPKKSSSSEITSIIGLIAGLIIYFFIFMYASQVMKGVIEEKTNRIIEVLVFPVKPFQFFGKDYRGGCRGTCTIFDMDCFWRRYHLDFSSFLYAES